MSHVLQLTNLERCLGIAGLQSLPCTTAVKSEPLPEMDRSPEPYDGMVSHDRALKKLCFALQTSANRCRACHNLWGSYKKVCVIFGQTSRKPALLAEMHTHQHPDDATCKREQLCSDWRTAPESHKPNH